MLYHRRAAPCQFGTSQILCRSIGRGRGARNRNHTHSLLPNRSDAPGVATACPGGAPVAFVHIFTGLWIHRLFMDSSVC
jgi:hypothetical protein